MKRFLIALLAGLSLASTAQAAPTPPDEVIRASTDKLQELISANHAQYSADKPGFYKVVDEVVVPRFNTRYIAQLILARNWRTATADQRTRFETAFKNMLVRTYADALLEYNAEVKAEIKPVRMAADATDVTVNTTLLRDNAAPIPLGFAMNLTDGQWKIYDITVESISLITTFRSQVAAEVKNSSLDAVIQKLEGGKVIEPAASAASG